VSGGGESEDAETFAELLGRMSVPEKRVWLTRRSGEVSWVD